MTTYIAGDVIDLTIRGARVVNYFPRSTNGTVTANVLVCDYDQGDERTFAVNVDAPTVSVEVTSPTGWPPQAGDVWEDRRGDQFFAFESAGVAELMRADGEDKFTADVVKSGGPLKLAYRRSAVSA